MDPSSRLLRWRFRLEEYDYEIVYKPGVRNTNADALSRINIADVNTLSLKIVQDLRRRKGGKFCMSFTSYQQEGTWE